MITPEARANTRLYFTAPSRSGSSLLVAALNCLKDVAVVNEPPDSYKIDQRPVVDAVFSSILDNLGEGFIMQRLDADGEEVTDTFPNKGISWQRKEVTFTPAMVVGIKKSFPSLGNKDYHNLFLDKWESFAGWFVKERKGKILAIVRNPLYTILSWKTTFEPLRAETTRQCSAWNRIASAILSTKDISYVTRFEDLVEDPLVEISRIASYLGVGLDKRQEFPAVRKDTNSLDYYLKARGLLAGNVGEDVAVIVEQCQSVASKFGYNLSQEAGKMVK